MPEHLTHTNRGTWIAHTLVSALATLVALTAGALLGGRVWALRCAALASCGVAAFYVVREGLQRARYRRDGRYTQAQRDDRVGDMVGPVALAVGVVLGWVLG